MIDIGSQAEFLMNEEIVARVPLRCASHGDGVCDFIGRDVGFEESFLACSHCKIHADITEVFIQVLDCRQIAASSEALFEIQYRGTSLDSSGAIDGEEFSDAMMKE